MASIYNTKQWDNSKSYVENDIVYHQINSQNRFFYATKSSSNQAPAEGSQFWKGILTLPSSSKALGHFFWKPSYSLNTNIAPKVKTIKLGNGYEQRLKDGFNNILLNYSLTFKNIDEKQATAISHFLFDKGAVEEFYFMAPTPIGIFKKFVCVDFQVNNKFFNNFDVNAKFQEKP
tara:strand:- start:540 stop:1064 length:525 start_codon:yes stop_codon:yes gene_type:complete